MRKGQIKLVEKAKLSGFSGEQIKLVEESTLALDDLQIFVRLIEKINENYRDASVMLNACLALAQYYIATRWMAGDSIQFIFFRLLKHNPTASDILWLENLTALYMKDKGRHKIYKIESKWECLLWMKQHDFSEEKILYILNAPVVEDDPFRARHIPIDHIIQVLDSSLGDEFKHNEECFIRWYLSQSSDPMGLYYARHKFDTLYDWDTHQFDCDLSQFYRKELSSPDYRGEQKRILKFDKQKLYACSLLVLEYSLIFGNIWLIHAMK